MVNNLVNQTSTLKGQIADLQSENETTTILLYAATFAAVVFAISTASIIVVVLKGKGKKKMAETGIF
jgi:hypothetical protein